MLDLSPLTNFKKLDFYNVYFHRGWKLKCLPNFSWCRKIKTKILNIIQGLSLEAKLIKTLVLVEISLGKESCLGGFEGKLWQLINSCWQLMKFLDIMDEKICSWLICIPNFMKLGWFNWVRLSWLSTMFIFIGAEN